MSLFQILLAVVAAILAFLFLKRMWRGEETDEDRALKSRAGAALGNALPQAFGGQSSSFLPLPDMTDRIEPENTHVARYEERVPEPESDHPFRKAALPRDRFAGAPIDVGDARREPARRRQGSRTPVEPKADG